jgi:hypothetical protein
MSRKSPDISLEELPGTLYSDLAAAQRACLKSTAMDLAATLRALLLSGDLVILNGKIIPGNH